MPTHSPASATAPASPPDNRTSPGGKRRGVDTWLTPYLDAWKATYGGALPPKRAVAALGPLHTQHGDAVVLPRWNAYLRQTDAQFAAPQRFAQTFGRWDPAKEPMSGIGFSDEDFYVAQR